MLSLALLVACHRPLPPAAPSPEVVEDWLITAAPDDTPMTIVTDDVPAGRALLASPSRPVDPADPLVTHLVARMRATLAEARGVGLAAPQVGVLRRVVLVKRLDEEGEPVEAWLNPVISTFSDETEVGWEGCLSIPEGRGQVQRATSIQVRGDTVEGPREEAVEGWTARIFQHELDHLDGVLFTDRMLSAALIPGEQYDAMKAGWTALEDAPEAVTEVPAEGAGPEEGEAISTERALRRATRPGRRLSWRVARGDAVGFEVLEFSQVDEDAVTIAQVQVWDGVAEAPTARLVPWSELVPHAERWTSGWADTPAGAFDARVVVDDTGEVTSWYATDLPGPPVRVEVRRGGQVVELRELVEHRPGA